MNKVLFLDREGTLVEKIPTKEKVIFYPKALSFMSRISRNFNYEIVLVTNQAGEKFFKAQRKIMKTFENEGVYFSAVSIDRNSSGVGMLESYDISGSFVIVDRITDVLLAKNLKCKAIWLKKGRKNETAFSAEKLQKFLALETKYWEKIYEFLKFGSRKILHSRKSKETDIKIILQMDGSGKYNICTGIGFLNHMLEQLAKHASIDLSLQVQGDLNVIEEHHTIEDISIALGEAFWKAFGNKLGLARYGFCLPMDEGLAKVALDFGGRSNLVFKVEFKREKIGDMQTEMVSHFFKSFSESAKCNLHIQAKGENEHHQIEAIFKAFAISVKMAVFRDVQLYKLPSTKNII
ncbi:MAG TPA: imidazoleglycerol-phosphate dehydratase HisB [Candidatus Angelobacter sp.]|jgi:imidazoleglycerol-phosphate dehydratase/histidinol-phosphatase|nr:imidazoleglycerol-phosphate dehydratase HisB [Candidatus Angelobacter sp.]